MGTGKTSTGRRRRAVEGQRHKDFVGTDTGWADALATDDDDDDYNADNRDEDDDDDDEDDDDIHTTTIKYRYEV